MKKKNRPKAKGFDSEFDAGNVSIDFSTGLVTKGLSEFVKLPPIDIPSQVALEIEKLAKRQGNSRAAVIRQLLLWAIEHCDKDWHSINTTT